MISIFVCLGSSCYLRGAYDLINAFQEAIAEAHLEDEVELKGAFCLNNCTDGVTIRINDELLIGVKPDDVSGIFREKVLKGLRGNQE